MQSGSASAAPYNWVVSSHSGVIPLNHLKTAMLVLATILCTAAYAQEQAIDEKILELLRVSNADQIVEGSHVQLQNLLFAEISVEALNAKQKEVLAKYRGEFDEILKTDLSRDRMLDSSIRFYKELFTAEEIQYLIDFYTTPTGQKLANELPTRMPQIIEETQVLIQEFVPKMLDLRSRLNDELQDSQ